MSSIWTETTVGSYKIRTAASRKPQVQFNGEWTELSTHASGSTPTFQSVKDDMGYLRMLRDERFQS